MPAPLCNCEQFLVVTVLIAPLLSLHLAPLIYSSAINQHHAMLCERHSQTYSVAVPEEICLFPFPGQADREAEAFSAGTDTSGWGQERVPAQ